MPVPVSDDTPSPLLLLLPLLSRFLTPPAHLSARLTKTQLLIVTALSYHESFHMSQLAAYLSFSKEQATRAAAPLVEAGLVERFAQLENRTRVFLRLTADGKNLADELRAQFSSQLKARVSASRAARAPRGRRNAGAAAVQNLTPILCCTCGLQRKDLHELFCQSLYCRRCSGDG